MTRRSTAPLHALTLDSSLAPPLHQQLYEQIRDAVLSGNLLPGSRLPSSRALAADLACARNTVLGAYEQLTSEGYLEARHGSGSYVSSVLPEELLTLSPVSRSQAHHSVPAGLALSARGQSLATQRQQPRGGHRAFTVGLPDLEAFPFELWGRLLGRIWRHPSKALLNDRDPAGHAPLRRAIAQYLNAVRGLGCQEDEILITTGAQQGVALVAQLLLQPGETAWIENPGYAGLRAPLQAAGAAIAPVLVDSQGFDVEAALRAPPRARLAVVAPSHQHPLGYSLSLPRRLALLDWAYESGGWILEDDYDSEYRYAGRPLAALRGLDAQRRDGGGRVIYLGSFSKVLFPSLRLGYLVVPRALVAAFVAARQALEDHPSMVAQPVVARFLESGQFAAHVRRMRLLYQRRQELLLRAADEYLAGSLSLQPDEAGMHLVASLSPDLQARVGDQDLVERARAASVSLSPLSAYYLGPPARQGLVMGYAAVPEQEIVPAVQRLQTVLLGL